MSTTDLTASARTSPLLPVLTAAIFLSAALLFAVQPMFTKMVLPRLGGAPQVWSVAMVFFQAALLAGYGYAHFLTRYAPGRKSLLIQLAVMVAACFMLPLSIASGWGKPPAVGEAFWLLGLFAVSIGLPFFALAANSPLLQAWFARSDHPAAKDPYFLYAASNVGSFLALLSYPLIIEPLIRLYDQTWLWTIGFYILILLIAGTGYLLRNALDVPAGPTPNSATVSATTSSPTSSPTWRDALSWVCLAAVPSGLLVAVTAHISTDVAAVPLLWVIPLALYLLTFVIVFASRPILPHWLVVAVQPLFILLLVTQMVLDVSNIQPHASSEGIVDGFLNALRTVSAFIFSPFKLIVGLIALHVTVFFVCALVCHGELARRRPAPEHLTAFYMWMSLGGMIGGIASGLIAPYTFNWIGEYPILIALAVLCRPGLALPKSYAEQIIFFGALAVAVLAVVLFRAFQVEVDTDIFNSVVAALLIVTVLFWRDPLPFAAIIAFVLLANHYVLEVGGSRSVRSFFGVLKISETYDGRFRLLSHGTTLHGGQRVRDNDGKPLGGRPEPIMYYYNGSAMAQILDAARARTKPIRYAVIGLGTGTLACRAEPGDTVHYYEIDPAMIRLATDPKNFSFLDECRPVTITLGDARLTLAEAPDQSYDVIIVDAFTSDAIPIHLLTREAMEIYRQKLVPEGIVAIHVSNRHLELASVVAGIAKANDMVSRVNEGTDVTENDAEYVFLGTVVAATAKDENFGPIAKAESWELQKPDPKQWVWTDDYSNIIGSILRRLRE
jgi:spermidine synthase